MLGFLCSGNILFWLFCVAHLVFLKCPASTPLASFLINSMGKWPPLPYAFNEWSALQLCWEFFSFGCLMVGVGRGEVTQPALEHLSLPLLRVWPSDSLRVYLSSSGTGAPLHIFLFAVTICHLFLVFTHNSESLGYLESLLVARIHRGNMMPAFLTTRPPCTLWELCEES